MAPEHPYVQGGMVATAEFWGAYIPVINATRSTPDLLHVQLFTTMVDYPTLPTGRRPKALSI